MATPNPTDWVNRASAGASHASREARMRRFAAFLEADPAGRRGATVVDAGGTLGYWREWAKLLPPGAVSRIDVVNLPGQMRELAGRTLEQDGVALRFVAADLTAGEGAGALDARYDVAHSVSTIEHVGDAAAQAAFAAALRRLGRRVWVQTPAKEFPLEAHFRLPFFAWLPLPVRAFFNWRFRLGVMPRHRDWREAVAFCRDTRLLTRRAFARLFPGCDVWTERCAGFPKCYLASGPGSAAP